MAKAKKKKVDSSEVFISKAERDYIYWSDEFKTFDGIILNDIEQKSISKDGLRIYNRYFVSKGTKVTVNIDEKTISFRVVCKGTFHSDFFNIAFESSEPKKIILNNRKKLIDRNLIKKTDFDL